MQNRGISQAVIRRLPRYYRYLGELIEQGVERISSNELSKRMKVTASQIRQDLNNFGGFGQQGYGYNVKYLYSEIGKILGLEQAKFLADHNVHGIWNFAHTDLNLPESVIVENVHLSESLMRLSYNICRYKEEHN